MTHSITIFKEDFTSGVIRNSIIQDTAYLKINDGGNDANVASLLFKKSFSGILLIIDNLIVGKEHKLKINLKQGNIRPEHHFTIAVLNDPYVNDSSFYFRPILSSCTDTLFEQAFTPTQPNIAVKIYIEAYSVNSADEDIFIRMDDISIVHENASVDFDKFTTETKPFLLARFANEADVFSELSIMANELQYIDRVNYAQKALDRSNLVKKMKETDPSVIATIDEINLEIAGNLPV